MLPKRNRLSRSEFSALLKKGRRLHGINLTVVLRPASEFTCGVVVSKKTARKATARNLLRRRIYATLRALSVQLGQVHLAVIARPSAASCSAQALEADLRSTLAKEYTSIRRTPQNGVQ